MTPLVLRELTKRFGATTAVDGVDLDVSAGELFFLLGPSGCGKTTLLRMLAGFVEPTAGTIRFGDRDVTHLPANRRNTGMVFQGYALWPHMTVAQNVAFGLDVRRIGRAEKRRRVEQALAAVHMSDYARRRPNALSGGQQQRVALARALVVEPTLLLLDEPLSNLDAKLRSEMRHQIRQVCKTAGITAVYVTHDQKEALAIADRIAVMDGGRVRQIGVPHEIYHRPADRFVADFLGETNFLPATVEAIDGDRLRLATPVGELHSTSYPEGLAPGGEVTCSIRPEALHIHHEHTGGRTANGNRFSATLEQLTYLGEIAQHHLAGPAGTSLRAAELNPRSLEPAGTTLPVSVEPADVVVLSE